MNLKNLSLLCYSFGGDLRRRLQVVSLFSWSVEQNARDTRMTTRVTEGTRRERHDKCRQYLFFLLGLPPSFLASRSYAAQHSNACALPLLNLKKKEAARSLPEVCLGSYR